LEHGSTTTSRTTPASWIALIARLSAFMYESLFCNHYVINRYNCTPAAQFDSSGKPNAQRVNSVRQLGVDNINRWPRPQFSFVCHTRRACHVVRRPAKTKPSVKCTFEKLQFGREGSITRLHGRAQLRRSVQAELC